MDLQHIILTDITNVFTVYSQKGRLEQMNSRSSYGLSLCLNGQITYVQDGVEYVSSPGRVVLLPKGQSYEIRGDRTGLFPVINFQSLTFLGDRVTVTESESCDQLIKDFEQLKKAFFFGESRPKQFSIFYGMLHTLSAPLPGGELLPAIRYLNANYHRPDLTNELLARQCKISEVYFRKCFAKQFGASPKQYVIGLRIQKAKQLLTEGVMTISAIAESCGFSNPYHFCRTFQERVGTSPSKYRSEHRIHTI